MAEDLSTLSRDELNAKAEEAGVENPEDLDKKSDVIAAIEEAEGTSTEVATTDEAPATTSSAEAHIEGVTAAEVPPDTGEGPHSSDAPDYPFPTAGDVDVETIPESNAPAGEEWMEPLTGGDVWVQLGEGDEIPEENRGAIATVIDSSTYTTDDGTEALDEEEPITVKVRDASSATLQISIHSVAKISRNGRTVLVPFA